LLLCLSARVYKTENFELLLSRKEIAELSGLSREKVIRILKEFKESKYIETQGKVIKILDYESLQKISDFG
jgi:CRP/FNR family transcriptional regulator